MYKGRIKVAQLITLNFYYSSSYQSWHYYYVRKCVSHFIKDKSNVYFINGELKVSTDLVICLKINFFTSVLTPSSPRWIYFHIFFFFFFFLKFQIYYSNNCNYLWRQTCCSQMLYLVDTVSRTQWFWESDLWWTTLSASIDSALHKDKYAAVLLEFCARRTHWLWTFVLLLYSFQWKRG